MGLALFSAVQPASKEKVTFMNQFFESLYCPYPLLQVGLLVGSLGMLDV